MCALCAADVAESDDSCVLEASFVSTQPKIVWHQRCFEVDQLRPAVQCLRRRAQVAATVPKMAAITLVRVETMIRWVDLRGPGRVSRVV